MPESLAQVAQEFAPDNGALFRALCQVVSSRELDMLALADVPFQYEANLRVLQSIVRTGRVPSPLEWEPREVCALIRWREPDEFMPDQLLRRSAASDRLHRCRLFGCSILLVAAGHGDPLSEGDNSTAAVALGSALVLGLEWVALLRQSLACLCANLSENDEERLVMALGLLLCAVTEAWQGPAAPGLRRLMDAIMREESEFRLREDIYAKPDWLLGLTIFDQRHTLWRSLARYCLLEPRHPHPPELDADLRLIGSMLQTTDA